MSFEFGDYIIQGGKKSLSAVTDEFYTLRFDGDTYKEPAARLTLTLNFKIKICFAFAYSIRYEGKLFSGRNFK